MSSGGRSMPVIAYAAGPALHLTAPQLLAVVVCAGLPTAQNTFIFGQEYGVDDARWPTGRWW